jgi:hypothetical protein
MKEWIGYLRKLQENLHASGQLTSDLDFVNILLTSLPTSWDMYMMSLLGAMNRLDPVKSHELISILINEFSR